MYIILLVMLMLSLATELANCYTKNLLRTGFSFRSHELKFNPIPIPSNLNEYSSKDLKYKKASHYSSNMNDEEEDESEDENKVEEVEDQSPVIETEQTTQISLIKQGLNISSNLNGSDVRVGIIMARWNADIIQGLYKGVNESLMQCNVKPTNVFTTYVPGAFELPITAKFLAASKRVDVIICLGCLIKGDTMHFEYIADATANGIMQVSLDTFVPCLFGVLTVLNKEQAIKRSQGTGNEGLHWGLSAVEMGLNRMSALGLDKPTAVEKLGDIFNQSTAIGKKNETKRSFGF